MKCRCFDDSISIWFEVTFSQCIKCSTGKPGQAKLEYRVSSQQRLPWNCHLQRYCRQENSGHPPFTRQDVCHAAVHGPERYLCSPGEDLKAPLSCPMNLWIFCFRQSVQPNMLNTSLYALFILFILLILPTATGTLHRVLKEYFCPLCFFLTCRA